MMSSPFRSRWLSLLALLLAAGGFSAAVGFVLGDRWGDGIRARWSRWRATPAPSEWTVAAETDLPRYEFLRVPLGDSVLIIGGFHSPRTLASLRVEMLDLRSGQWSRRADMPMGLTHAMPARVGDTVWVAGGFEGDHPGPATRRVWRYNMREDRWQEGPQLPDARGSGALVARGDTLHFVSGYLADRNTDAPEHWRLVPGDSVWRERAALPNPRGHISAAVIDGAIYTMSGNIGHDPLPIDVRLLERYDADADRWQARRSSPFALSHNEPSTFVYAGGLMSAGGRSREIGRDNGSEIMWYQPDTDRWRFITRGPVPMLGGIAFERQDTVYYGLGAAFRSDPTTSRIWKRPLRNTWHQFDSMPVALGEVAGGIIGDSLYLVGQGSPTTAIFDLALGKWLPTHHPPVRPAPGNHHAAEVIGDKLYLFGGIGRFAEGEVQVLDPATGSWSLRTPMPFAAGSSASALIAGVVYVAGGIAGDTTTGETAAYDAATDSWTMRAPMPRPRNHAASATDGERLYVFGGRGKGSGDGNVVANGFDDVQIYDPTTDRWIVSDGSPGAPAALPQARGGTGKAVYLEGEFWVIGGETLDGENANGFGTYARVDVYNPRTNQWRRAPDLPTARHGIFPLVDHGRVLVVGGGARAGRGESRVFEVIWP